MKILSSFLFLLFCLSSANGGNEGEVNLPEIKFYPKSAIIPAADKEKLAVVVQYLKNNPAIRLEIRGYSDAEKDMEEGRRLAKERVQNVLLHLKSSGISGSRLLANVYGAFNHLPNDESSSLNRKVEFLKVIEENTRAACEESLMEMLRKSSVNPQMYKDYLERHGSDKAPGLCFKVQVSAHRPSSAKLLFPFLGDAFRVEREVYDDYIRYTVGCYETFCQALESRRQLIAKGAAEDSWIVAYDNGKRLVSLSLAANMFTANGK